MTYLEFKKVLCRRIHDVANLKTVNKNNGAVIKLVEYLAKRRMLFQKHCVLAQGIHILFISRHAQDDFELLTETSGQKNYLINYFLPFALLLSHFQALKKLRLQFIIINSCTVSCFLSSSCCIFGLCPVFPFY